MTFLSSHRPWGSIIVISDRFSPYSGNMGSTPKGKSVNSIAHQSNSSAMWSPHLESQYPQTDGQTKRLNRGIEDYIRCYIQPNHKNWVDLLDTLEFCYNSTVHSATGFTLFQLSTGVEVLTPLAVAETQPSLEQHIREFKTSWIRGDMHGYKLLLACIGPSYRCNLMQRR